MRITEPLPNWRSIWPSAVSRACSRSTLINLPISMAQRHVFECFVVRPVGAQPGQVNSRVGRHDLAELRQRRVEPGALAEAQDRDVREPRPRLAPVQAELLE